MSERLSNISDEEIAPKDTVNNAEQIELDKGTASSTTGETTDQTNQEEEANQEREFEERSAAEFLLSFQDLKTDVRQEATKAISTIETSIVKGKNMLSMPKNIILNWRVEKAKQKYDRISRKLDTSRFDFINRHYEKKVQTVSSDLNSRTQVYAEHTEMMQNRSERADEHSKERQEAIDTKRKELHEARVAAVERRIVRHESIKQRRKLEHDYSQYAYEKRETAIKQYIEQPAFKKRVRSQAEKIVQGQKNEKLHNIDNEKDAENQIERAINEENKELN